MRTSQLSCTLCRHLRLLFDNSVQDTFVTQDTSPEDPSSQNSYVLAVGPCQDPSTFFAKCNLFTGLLESKTTQHRVYPVHINVVMGIGPHSKHGHTHGPDLYFSGEEPKSISQPTELWDRYEAAFTQNLSAQRGYTTRIPSNEGKNYTVAISCLWSRKWK